ncbi:MAG: prohibitin family protein [Chloroflexi bacterium]|nr:prohibitin family protein [Chloroflexota bacterium]
MSNQNFTRGRINFNGRVLWIGLVVVLVVWLLASTFKFVPPQTSAVVISYIAPGGYRKEPLQSGLHLLIPFVEYIETYSISNQTYTMASQASEGDLQRDDSIRARTKDGQEVFIDASVIFSIDPEKVVDLHIIWQDRYDEGLVRPTARGIVRDVASQYGVEEIVSSKRSEMEDTITTLLEEKFAENDLVLVDFVLRDIHFSEEYAAAVEQKQIAEQQAQQAEFVIAQKKAEAEQARQTAQGQADAAVIAAQGAAQARLIEADAEAKALDLIAAVLAKNPLLLQYQYITKLAPGVQTIFIPTGNQFILPLPSTTTPTPTTPTVPAQ